MESIVYRIEKNLFILREDLLPFSFGGNKARKSALFFEEIDNGNYDCVVTYGSSSSNHCRVVSNMCSCRGIKCFIISPEESSNPTFNSKLMDLFGAEIEIVPVADVHNTIEKRIGILKSKGLKPYFIPGGGHGNIGTQAYVNCYDEICEYEQLNGIHFDYIFFATGTGTTQAGLVCGQLKHNDQREIIGISIARELPRGRNIIIESIKEYLGESFDEKEANEKTIFVDTFAKGYGTSTNEIQDTIDEVMCKYGIPLDETYTGKAFYGMREYIKEKGIKDKNILFIHTGGTPLFFDFLKTK